MGYTNNPIYGIQKTLQLMGYKTVQFMGYTKKFKITGYTK